MYKIKLEQFEGPLDLLLQLIEQQELDITQVSLATVTDQYIECLHQAENINLEELADFLVVASKLLLIKSKTLLPELDFGDAEEATDLENQLKIYKEYLEASKTIQGLIAKRNFTFAREKSPIEAPVFNPPREVTATKLKETFQEILKALKLFVPLPKSIIKRTISIQDKIRQIKDLILAKAAINFKTILFRAKNKTEVIVSFLALLELVKQKAISVSQNQLFDDIEIKKNGEWIIHYAEI